MIESSKKAIEEENQRLRKMLQQKPEGLTYEGAESDDEPKDVAEELKRGDVVRIMAPVHLGSEYITEGETGVVQRVPGDGGLAAVLTIGTLTFNAPQRYFRKVRNSYAVGEKVKFNKSIKLRSGKVIEAGDVGEVMKVPGDNGAVAEIVVNGVAYGAAMTDIRRYLGMEKAKNKPMPTLAAAPAPAPRPAAPASPAPAAGAAAAPLTPPAAAVPIPPAAVPVGGGAPAAPVLTPTPVARKELLLACQASVAGTIRALAGKFVTGADANLHNAPLWKHVSENAWLYLTAAADHWVVTDDPADFAAGKGWFMGSSRSEDGKFLSPWEVVTWVLPGVPPLPAPGIKLVTYTPPALDIDTHGVGVVRSGRYTLAWEKVNGMPYWESAGAAPAMYLYSSSNQYWVVTDNKGDFAGGQGFMFTAEQHKGHPPTHSKHWVVDNETKAVDVKEAAADTVPAAGKPSAKVAYAVGDAVRIRDSESDDWKEGKVTDVNADGAPVVQANGHTKGFEWAFVEPKPKAAAAAKDETTSEKEKQDMLAKAREDKEREEEKAMTAEHPSSVRLSSDAAKLKALVGVYKKDGVANGRPVYAHEFASYWVYATSGADGGWSVTNSKEDFLTDTGFIHSVEMNARRGPQQIKAWEAAPETVEPSTAFAVHAPAESVTLVGAINDVKEEFTLKLNKNRRLVWCQNVGSKNETEDSVEELIYENSLLRNPSGGYRHRVRLDNPSADVLRTVAHIAKEAKVPARGFPVEGRPPTTDAIQRSDKQAIDDAQFKVGEKVEVRDDDTKPWQAATVSEVDGGVVHAKPQTWDKAFVFQWIRRGAEGLPQPPRKWNKRAVGVTASKSTDEREKKEKKEKKEKAEKAAAPAKAAAAPAKAAAAPGLAPGRLGKGSAGAAAPPAAPAVKSAGPASAPARATSPGPASPGQSRAAAKAAAASAAAAATPSRHAAAAAPPTPAGRKTPGPAPSTPAPKASASAAAATPKRAASPPPRSAPAPAAKAAGRSAAAPPAAAASKGKDAKKATVGAAAPKTATQALLGRPAAAAPPAKKSKDTITATSSRTRTSSSSSSGSSSSSSTSSSDSSSSTESSSS
eukprot:TRINITY_DN2418_c2_g1_i1.p2 TRINITY_DN2418_c2_g1~~TRINITY_DN2418_c2_g1_i1.p2  ORF type:complete len:1087 (+),score=434.92 TRINITY_DN2418_c2_g1_i1:2828-6088(+)